MSCNPSSASDVAAKLLSEINVTVDPEEPGAWEHRQRARDGVSQALDFRLARPIMDRGHAFCASSPEIESKNLKAWKFARNWKPGGPNVWLCGPPGTSKTFLSRCVAAKWLFGEGRLCGEIKGSVIAREWPRLFPERLEPKMREAKRPPHLIIDDIDVNVWTATAAVLLKELLDIRCERHLTTWVTANQDPALFFNDLNSVTNASPILDRLKPMVTLRMVGDSARNKT